MCTRHHPSTLTSDYTKDSRRSECLFVLIFLRHINAVTMLGAAERLNNAATHDRVTTYSTCGMMAAPLAETKY